MRLLHVLTLSVLTVVQGAEPIVPENGDIHLNFTWGYDVTPDCVKRQPLVTVNGVWPPPTIRVKAKEKITLRAHNELVAVAFTIHLHGFDQVDTPWADGTSMISTCPIPPDTKSSTQVFYAPDQPGTYIYHGHVAHAKVAGFTGMLLVDENREENVRYNEFYTHDDELELLMADSYHSPSLPAMAGLLQQNFRWVGDPQTILMNGRSYFNCTNNAIYECSEEDELCTRQNTTDNQVCGAGNTVYYNTLVHCEESYCQDRTTLHVDSGKTYLLHLANGGVSAMLNTAIQGHTMKVVEIDGIPVNPQVVESLDLHAGQRAGVLITADQPEGVYWISSIVRGRKAVRTGGALLVYNSIPHTLNGQNGEDDQARKDLIATQPVWDNWDFMRLQQQLFESLVPETMPTLQDVDKTFVFLQTQERFAPHTVDNSPTGGDASGLGIGDKPLERPQCKCNATEGGFLKWAVDRKTFINPTTPLLHSMYFETNKKNETLLEAEGYYKLYKGKVYDVVLQNYPNCNGACEVHPWHLHGHHFWHVGTFEGAYDPKVGYPEDKTGGFYKRDTILVVGAEEQHPDKNKCSGEREPCGYTVIRFEADNPGAWFFHCHIDWHLIMGMGVAFYYDDLPNTAPPPDLSVYDICGDVYPQVVIDQILGNTGSTSPLGTSDEESTGKKDGKKEKDKKESKKGEKGKKNKKGRTLKSNEQSERRGVRS